MRTRIKQLFFSVQSIFLYQFSKKLHSAWCKHFYYFNFKLESCSDSYIIIFLQEKVTGTYVWESLCNRHASLCTGHKSINQKTDYVTKWYYNITIMCVTEGLGLFQGWELHLSNSQALNIKLIKGLYYTKFIRYTD